MPREAYKGASLAVLIAFGAGLICAGLAGVSDKVGATHARLADVHYRFSEPRDTKDVIMLLLRLRNDAKGTDDARNVPDVTAAVRLAHEGGARAIGVSTAISRFNEQDQEAFRLAIDSARAILGTNEAAGPNRTLGEATIRPVPLQAATADGLIGFLNVEHDENNVVRLINCCAPNPETGELEFAFPIRIAAAFHSAVPTVLSEAVVRVGIHTLRFTRTPLSNGTESWSLRLRYPGASSLLDRVEGLNAAREAAKNGRFQGKTVVVGFYGGSKLDTPLGRWDGTEIQAAAVASLQRGDYLKPAPNKWRWTAMALSALFSAGAATVLNGWSLPAVLSGQLLLVFGLGQLLFGANLVLYWSELALSGLASFAIALGLRTDWASRLIHTLTGLRRPGTRGYLDVAVLISDARGSSKAAAALDPAKNKAALDRLYALSAGAVSRSGGLVNKYMGDGMLAIFEGPDKTDRALACALDLLGSDMPLPVGVAIHTGRVFFGFVGEGDRKDYTVIGDAVNVTARLESCNKELGTDLLVSDEARRQMTAANLVEVGAVELRGLDRRMQVFTVSPVNRRLPHAVSS